MKQTVWEASTAIIIYSTYGIYSRNDEIPS
jgi:hypothetical protein